MTRLIAGAVLALLFTFSLPRPGIAQPPPQTAGASDDASADPYLWLEDVLGERALNWVKDQNARSLAILENEPRFASMRDEAAAILTSTDRIPYGQIHDGAVYNFWQDEAHVRGLWRRASVDSYKAGAPEWETVLDYDALARSENRNWVRGSVVCLNPEFVHCMVELSDGGTDAGVWREFNTETKKFVEGGFYVAEAKSFVSWRDENTLFVGTDRGPGTLTASGYPRLVVEWARGGAIADAPVIMEGAADDVSVVVIAAQSETDPHIIGWRSHSFFERSFAVRQDDGVFAPLPLPRNTDYQGVLDGRAIFSLREAWRYDGASYPQGAVIAFDLDAGAAELVYKPSKNQAVRAVGVGKSSIMLSLLEDVAGKAIRLTRKSRRRGWSAKSIKLPANGVVSLSSTGGGTDAAMISFESMTTPDTLFFVDQKNAVAEIRRAPAFYDAADVVVDQRFATSTDGEKIPYFVMGRKDVLEKGNAPTIQYGYGGFLVPILPVYYSDPGRPQHGALAGKLWVARGGVLVLANIRGGAEYGPRWHQAALKKNRQLGFDDFFAISEALINTGVTSPEKLGAIGRSNGGLLMGALLTQRPELYAAIDIGVPLLDMKRYNKLLAGASWMGEYGDPDIPAQWEYISQYSPYQRLAADQPYPKVLFYTSTKDDRVHPGHARKAAAKMADLGYEFFYYENIEGGHGGTANQDQLAYRTALEFAYFAHQLLPTDKNGPGEERDAK